MVNENTEEPEKKRARRERILGFLIPILMIAAFSRIIIFLLPQSSWTFFSYAWFPSESAASAFAVIFTAWGFIELLNAIWSRMNSEASDKDMGSLWVVIGAIYATFIVIFLSRSLGVWSFSGILQYVGLVLAVLGIMFREWSIFVLGRHFTVQVQVRKKARLVTEGPYRYIRHPSYSGGFLTFIGVALAVGSLPGLLFIIVLIGAYDYRMKVEEKALQEAFGQEFVEYKKRTWRLFPGY